MIFKRLDDLSRLIHEAQVTLKNGETLPLPEAVSSVHRFFQSVKKEGRNIYLVGNGGSAGIVSHHAVDLVNVVKAPAVALVEPGLLTCIGNDYGYEQTFSKPLESLAHPGDLLIAVSSSGKSKNILNACETMRAKQGKVITLSGFRGDNPLRLLGDLNFWTGKDDYGLVETAHFFVLHTIIDLWSGSADGEFK
jgi:D-sedoheptulose 7-phosphate isomerase